MCGGSQHFSSGHSGHMVGYTICKHQTTLLNDDVKLVNQPPIRVGTAHEFTGLLIWAEDDEGLMPIPRAICPSIRGSHPKAQKPVSYTHLRAHETPEHLVCRL